MTDPYDIAELPVPSWDWKSQSRRLAGLDPIVEPPANGRLVRIFHELRRIQTHSPVG
jgi:hypothetical protein